MLRPSPVGGLFTAPAASVTFALSPQAAGYAWPPQRATTAIRKHAAAGPPLPRMRGHVALCCLWCILQRSPGNFSKFRLVRITNHDGHNGSQRPLQSCSPGSTAQEGARAGHGLRQATFTKGAVEASTGTPWFAAKHTKPNPHCDPCKATSAHQPLTAAGLALALLPCEAEARCQGAKVASLERAAADSWYASSSLASSSGSCRGGRAVLWERAHASQSTGPLPGRDAWDCTPPPSTHNLRTCAATLLLAATCSLELSCFMDAWVLVRSPSAPSGARAGAVAAAAAGSATGEGSWMSA